MSSLLRTPRRIVIGQRHSVQRHHGHLLKIYLQIGIEVGRSVDNTPKLPLPRRDADPRSYNTVDGKCSFSITLRRPDLHLSYRQGYFADKPRSLPPNQHKLSTLLADDPKQVTAPDLRSNPIQFEASVHPASQPAATNVEFVPLRPAAPPAKGATAFHVDYSLSTAGLSPAQVDGASRATLVFAAIALDSNGERIGQTLDRVRFALAPGDPPRTLLVEQQIDLPKGGDFIALAVWDPVSGHLGTLQIPVTVTSKSK